MTDARKEEIKAQLRDLRQTLRQLYRDATRSPRKIDAIAREIHDLQTTTQQESEGGDLCPQQQRLF